MYAVSYLRLQVRQVRRAVTNCLEVVDGERYIGGAGDCQPAEGDGMELRLYLRQGELWRTRLLTGAAQRWSSHRECG